MRTDAAETGFAGQGPDRDEMNGLNADIDWIVADAVDSSRGSGEAWEVAGDWIDIGKRVAGEAEAPGWADGCSLRTIEVVGSGLVLVVVVAAAEELLDKGFRL